MKRRGVFKWAGVSGLVCCFFLLISSAPAVSAPAISSLNPTSGSVGMAVTIEGGGFGASQGENVVTFGAKQAAVSLWSKTRIIVAVPGGAVSGDVKVALNIPGQPPAVSNPIYFTVSKVPVLNSISPTRGPVGAEVTLVSAGGHFGAAQGSSRVVFDETTPAQVVSWSKTTIKVKVPKGAATGNVVAIVDSRRSNGIRFEVAGTAIPLFDNWNSEAAYWNPSNPTDFTIYAGKYITRIVNYHKSPTGIETPGTIKLRREDGKIFGPWPAIGKPGADGTANTVWVCYPRVALPAGKYTVIDSESNSWAQNASSSHAGMSRVEAGKPPVEVASKMVAPSTEPTTLAYLDQVSVTVPGGLVDSSKKLGISSIVNVPPPNALPHGMLSSYNVSLGDLHQLDKPVTLEFTYDPNKLRRDLSPSKSLSVAYWDPDQHAWVKVPSTVDPTKNKITAKSNHLSIFGFFMLLGDWEYYEVGPFNFIYDRAELDALPASYWYTTPVNHSDPQIPDFAEDVMAFMMTAYNRYQGLGFKMPKSLDVYIGTDLSNFREKFTKLILISTASGTPNILRHTTAHELFHAVQNEYYYALGGMSSHKWWVESTADYAAERIAWPNAGLRQMGKDIWFDYLEYGLDNDGAPHHEGYDTAHFIDFLVGRGANFKAMWDFVTKPYYIETLSVFLPLNRYLESVHGVGNGLPEEYAAFARFFVFDPSSPMPALTDSLRYEVASIRKTLGLDDDEAIFDFSLAAGYTARLGSSIIDVEDVYPYERPLNVEIDGYAPPGARIEVYRLTDDNPETALRIDTLNASHKQAALTCASNQSVYLLAVNPTAVIKRVKAKISDTHPLITNITPSSGQPGTSFTIVGKRFGAEQGTGVVHIGGIQAVVTSWSDTKIEGVVNAVGGGIKEVQVHKTLPSNVVAFTVNLLPMLQARGNVFFEFFGRHQTHYTISATGSPDEDVTGYTCGWLGKTLLEYAFEESMSVPAVTWNGTQFTMNSTGYPIAIYDPFVARDLTAVVTTTVSGEVDALGSKLISLSYTETYERTGDPPANYLYVNETRTVQIVAAGMEAPISCALEPGGGYTFSAVLEGSGLQSLISDFTYEFHFAEEENYPSPDHWVYEFMEEYLSTAWAAIECRPALWVRFR